MSRRFRALPPARLVGGRAAPMLRTLWAERHPIFEDMTAAMNAAGPGFHVNLRPLATLAGLTAEGDAVRADIAAARSTWPPRRVLGTDSREVSPVSAHFSWRTPTGFVNLPTVQRLLPVLLELERLQGRAGRVGEDNASLFVDMLYAHAMWRAYGRRVYYVDQGTADLLLQTRIPSFPATDLKEPLPSFAIVPGAGVFRFGVTGDPTPQEVDSIYVTFGEAGPAGDREIALMITGRSTKEPGDDNFFSSVVAVRPGMRLDEIAFAPLGQATIGDDLIRLVIGLCLYLSSEHPSIVPVPAPPDPRGHATAAGKLRKRAQRAARQTRLGYVWVGGREESDIPADAPRLKRWALDHAFWVQGYWRQQRYGSGRALVRPQWIKPYQKGPDFAEAMHTRGAQIQAASPAAAEEIT